MAQKKNVSSSSKNKGNKSNVKKNDVKGEKAKVANSAQGKQQAQEAVEQKKKTKIKVQFKKDTNNNSNQSGEKQPLIKPKFIKFLTYVVILFLTLVVVDLVVQYINNDYSVAIVNGYRIPRNEFEKRLAESYGEVIASQLVNERLILEEAQKEEVVVSDDEIQELVDNTIEDIGGREAFESALASNGLTEESYKRNIKLQLLAEKMVVTEPTEEELLSFFTEFKEVYFEEDSTFEDVKEDVRELYKNQKFNEQSSAWLSDLRDSANIQNNITNEPSYGFLTITKQLFVDVNNRLND